jgi:hypothetical protein
MLRHERRMLYNDQSSLCVTLIGIRCFSKRYQNPQGLRCLIINLLQRLQDLELLEDDKKKTLFDLIDTYIRDAKRKAHAA